MKKLLRDFLALISILSSTSTLVMAQNAEPADPMESESMPSDTLSEESVMEDDMKSNSDSMDGTDSVSRSISSEGLENTGDSGSPETDSSEQEDD